MRMRDRARVHASAAEADGITFCALVGIFFGHLKKRLVVQVGVPLLAYVLNFRNPIRTFAESNSKEYVCAFPCGA